MHTKSPAILRSDNTRLGTCTGSHTGLCGVGWWEARNGWRVVCVLRALCSVWADGLMGCLPLFGLPNGAQASHRWPDSAQYKEASSVPPAVGQSRELILCETQPPSHTRRPDPTKPKPAGALHSPSTFPARHTTHLGLRGTQRANSQASPRSNIITTWSPQN